MPGERYEVVVMGGGPGGSALGGLLAQAGRKVLVVERESFPRFHIGESLLPLSCGVYEKLGLMDALRASCTLKYGATFVDGPTSKQVRYRFAEGFDDRYEHAFQVRRAHFDALLLDRARALGCEVRQPLKVEEVIFDGPRARGVRLDGGEAVEAEIVVDATGRDSLLATRFARRRRIPGLDQTAIYAHYEGVTRLPGEAAGDVIIPMFDHGWFWVIPFQDGQSSVGVVLSKEYLRSRGDEPMASFFERTLELFPFMRQTMKGARAVTEVRTAADFSYRVDPMIGDGWLSVGDAFGFIDPLFSSGVHVALRSAEAASQAIDEALASGETGRSAFVAYEKKMRYASGLFIGVVQATYEGEFRDMLFADEQRQTLRRVITSLLSGDVFHDDPPPAWIRFVAERFQPQL